MILRELITFADEGADVFFGEPEFEVAEFLRIAADGRGIISLLEVPGVADKPALFSTFLMYLLAELFEILPEVGDLDKPKLVFFFDEAHLLFRDASKDFTAAIVQTVRLIRSKGVGVFFVTQTPEGCAERRARPARLARAARTARVHAGRCEGAARDGRHLSEVRLRPRAHAAGARHRRGDRHGDEREGCTDAGRVDAPARTAGADVADTRTREIDAAVAASPLLAKYGTAVDPESAREILTAKMNAAAEAAAAEDAALAKAKADAEYAKQQAAIEKAQAAADKKAQAEYDRLLKKTSGSSRTTRRTQKSPIESILNSKSTQTILNSVIRGVFGTGRR